LQLIQGSYELEVAEKVKQIEGQIVKQVAFATGEKQQTNVKILSK
jgi:hypothetical protein